jgi:hypothetical protein
MDAVANFFGIIGTVMSVVFFAAPGKSIFEGLKTGEIKNVSTVYLKAQAIMTSFWFTFGFKANDMILIITNISGFLLVMTFITIYHYVYKEYNDLVISISAAVLLIIVDSFLGLQVLELLAFVLGIVCTASMYIKIRETLSTKDAGYTNLQIIIGGLVNSIVWVCYGVLIGVTGLWVGSGMFTITVLINAFVYAWAMGNIHDDNVVLRFLKLILVIDESGYRSVYQKNKLIEF